MCIAPVALCSAHVILNDGYVFWLPVIRCAAPYNPAYCRARTFVSVWHSVIDGGFTFLDLNRLLGKKNWSLGKKYSQNCDGWATVYMGLLARQLSRACITCLCDQTSFTASQLLEELCLLSGKSKEVEVCTKNYGDFIWQPSSQSDRLNGWTVGRACAHLWCALSCGWVPFCESHKCASYLIV